MTNRRIGVPLSQEGAFENLEIAAEAVGKVEESNRHASYLIIKARHGLNPVRIRCSVMSGGTDSSSVIEFSGRGQDIWGVASRKMIDALIDVLAEQAANNSKEQFAASPDLDKSLDSAIIDAMDAHQEMSRQALNSSEVKRRIKEILLRHAGLYEALRGYSSGG